MPRTLRDIEDELLVLRGQDGDREALRLLVERWQPRLLGIARSLTGRPDAAADAVQETWVGMMRSLRRLDDPARFKEWICRILTNKCADTVRAWQRDRKLQRSAPPRPAEKTQDDHSPELRAAMASLSDAHRTVVLLHYVGELDVRTIARVVGAPVGTVKSRLHHAREALRSAIENVETERTCHGHVG
jgi:RNA polymerase sigma-70 factor (ECF subfamily)